MPTGRTGRRPGGSGRIGVDHGGELWREPGSIEARGGDASVTCREWRRRSDRGRVHDGDGQRAGEPAVREAGRGTRTEERRGRDDLGQGADVHVRRRDDRQQGRCGQVTVLPSLGNGTALAGTTGATLVTDRAVEHPGVLCGALGGDLDFGRCPEGDVPDLDGGGRHRRQDGDAGLVQPGRDACGRRQVAGRLPLRHLGADGSNPVTERRSRPAGVNGVIDACRADGGGAVPGVPVRRQRDDGDGDGERVGDVDHGDEPDGEGGGGADASG